jgi:hypothetical protein
VIDTTAEAGPDNAAPPPSGSRLTSKSLPAALALTATKIFLTDKSPAVQFKVPEAAE